MDHTNFAARMKGYEQHFTRQSLPANRPFLVRLDGKNFSRWTKPIQDHAMARNPDRPYSELLALLFARVAQGMAEAYHACYAYTQSDEITLVFSGRDDPIFGGRTQKINSVMAADASVRFNQHLQELAPESVYQRLPGPALFDARAFAVPDEGEATNAVIWREQDAQKNAISMLARHFFSHKSLHGQNGARKVERLHEEVGIVFSQEPAWFRIGQHFARRRRRYTLGEADRETTPPEHHAWSQPDQSYWRTVYCPLELHHSLASLPHPERVAMIFHKETTAGEPSDA